MNHIASSSSNGSTITIEKGDTLTVVLHTSIQEPVGTAWSFRDHASYQPILTLEGMESKNGVRKMDFRARVAGEAEIALQELYFLGFPSEQVIGHFNLKVQVL